LDAQDRALRAMGGGGLMKADAKQAFKLHHGVHHNCPTCQCGSVDELGPEDFSCKYCDKPVRYASHRGYGMAFEAMPVLGGPYDLIEELNADQSEATGEWLAHYIRADERDPTQLAFRKHNCKGKKK
jgi:hypothetical protein